MAVTIRPAGPADLDAMTALARRDRSATLVICPAGGASKRAFLETTGHSVALVWHIKRVLSD